MNRQELAWKRFEKTGCIADYLAYCQQRLPGSAGTERELSHVDIDRRHRSENEGAGQ